MGLEWRPLLGEEGQILKARLWPCQGHLHYLWAGAPLVPPACSGLPWRLSLGFPGLSVLGPHRAGFISSEAASASKGRVWVSVLAVGQACDSGHRPPSALPPTHPPNSRFPWVKVWGWNTFRVLLGVLLRCLRGGMYWGGVENGCQGGLCPHWGIWATLSLASPVTGPGSRLQAGAGELPHLDGAPQLAMEKGPRAEAGGWSWEKKPLSILLVQR